MYDYENYNRISNRISCLASMIDTRKSALCMCRDAEMRKNIQEEIDNLEKQVDECRNELKKFM